MSTPVDLLLITWNRRGYVDKTIPHLLACLSDFRLYCWDNASSDGTADIISAINDPRVAGKYFSRENVGQRNPCLWFFEQARSDVVGKLDDDVLLPEGWIERIAPLIRAEPRFGMLGCWNFMPEDWDEELAAPKVITMRGAQILPSVSIGGCSFLARREHLIRYILPEGIGYGIPIDRVGMSLDGLVHGFPLPILMAHHMDDPRSPHCIMNRPGGMGEQSSLTARKLGFASLESYSRWIAADARRFLVEPYAWGLRRARWKRNRSLLGRLRWRLFRSYLEERYASRNG